MFKQTIAVAGALVLLAFSVQVEAANRMLKNEAEFRAKIVGKKLTSKESEVLFNADGSYSGSYKSREMSGNWWFKNDRYCRSLTIANRDYSDKCQDVVFGDGTVKIGRTTYELK